jgi:hypothetical protein
MILPHVAAVIQYHGVLATTNSNFSPQLLYRPERMKHTCTLELPNFIAIYARYNEREENECIIDAFSERGITKNLQ